MLHMHTHSQMRMQPTFVRTSQILFAARCMHGAYLFLLSIALLSLVRPHVPLPPTSASPPFPSLPVSCLTHPVSESREALSPSNMPKALTDLDKAYRASVQELGRRCWDEGVKDLLGGGEAGLDSPNVDYRSGALFLGQYAGLWTFDINAGTYQMDANGFDAFRAFATSWQHEVSCTTHICSVCVHSQCMSPCHPMFPPPPPCFFFRRWCGN
jgi:hypothetical protein